MTTALSPVPQAGKPAPDFTLASTAGEPVTLSSLRGKNVLIAFFPLAFSRVCTTEFCAMRDDYSQFTERGVEVLPISVDSLDSLREFRKMHGVQPEMLSDFKRDVSRLYGTLLEDRFYSNRAYFLVDRDGIIRWAHVEERPGVRRENAEILAEIDRLNQR